MIDQRLVPIALEQVDTTNFERFGQTFYGSLQDREFVPLGGMHDGGAEVSIHLKTIQNFLVTRRRLDSCRYLSKRHLERRSERLLND